MKPVQHQMITQGVRIAMVLAVALTLASAAAADYREECQSEGCSTEEVEELYESYEEECLHEGCSFEEVIELAGHPSSVSAMLNDFKERGWKVAEEHFLAANCTPVGSNTQCIAFVLFCQDIYQCPSDNPAGPPTTSAWYACGACLGFGGDGC